MLILATESHVRTLRYARKIRLLQPNAHLYLLNMVILGLGQGIHRLLFNFFVLSQGYSETFLGTLISVNSMGWNLLDGLAPDQRLATGKLWL